MFKSVYRRFISVILTLSMLVSFTPAFAEGIEEAIVSENIELPIPTATPEPTAAPMIEEELFEDCLYNNTALYKTVTPEPARILIQENSDEESDRIVPNEIDETISDDNFIQIPTSELSTQSMSSTSIIDKYELYQSSLMENINAKSLGGNTYIDGKTGNLTYKRNDISIPLKNGRVLEVPIKYDSSDAYAIISEGETTNLLGDLHLAIRHREVSPLGVGWSYNISQMTRGVITLADGRCIKINSSTKEAEDNYYNDVSVEYDSSRRGLYIYYLDGRKEFFDQLSFSSQESRVYVSESYDKYGNIIYYEHEQNEPEKITSIYSSCNNTLKLNIIYRDSYVTINCPDGNWISYIKGSVALTYGENYLATPQNTTVKSIIGIEYGDDSEVKIEFKYQSMDGYYFNTLCTGILPSTNEFMYADEARVYAVLTEINDKSKGHIRKYTYEYSSMNCPVINLVKIPAVTIIKNGNDAVLETNTYTYALPDDITSTTKTVKTNGITVTTKYDEKVTGGYATTENVIREYAAHTIPIVSNTVTKYPENKKHIPYYIETNSYGSNSYDDDSLYITSKHEYEYNEKDQITEIKETVEGQVKNIEYNSYSGNAYSSLISTELKNGSGVTLSKKTYTVNEIGDVTAEYIYGTGTEWIQHNIYAYDENHNIYDSEQIAANGSFVGNTYEYYSTGLLASIYSQKNNMDIYAQHMNYEASTNRVSSMVDGVNNKTYYEYDFWGRVKKQTNPDNTYSMISYSNYTPVITTTNELGYKLTYTYDDGQLVKVSENDGSEETTLITAEMDDWGNIETLTDAVGNTTSYEYDSLGRKIKITAPDINNKDSITWIYYLDVIAEGDNKYSVILTVDPENKMNLEYYDIYGRLVKTAIIVDPGRLTDYIVKSGQGDMTYFLKAIPSDVQMIITSTTEYNDLDQPIRVTDGEGRVTEYAYDVLGNVLSVNQGETGKNIYVEYEYNPNGNVTKMSVGTTNPHVTTYEYDPAGRLVKMTDPMNFTEAYEYDNAGNLTRSKDKNGVWTTNTYDNRNRLISTTKGGKTISYTYDSVGNILTQTDENGIISYTYNLDGTLRRKTMPDGKYISYDWYDANKRLCDMTDYFGNETFYGYDAHGNITGITQLYSGETASKRTTYTYNQDGTLSTVSNPNSMTTTYTYDFAGRVTGINNSAPYMSAHSTHAYVYDNANNIIQATETMFGHSTTTTTYTYDKANRLVEEHGGAFWGEYFYNQYNNMSGSGGSEDRVYIYDANNRLIKVEDYYVPGETANGEVYDDWETYFVYDNNGKLLSSSKNSAPDYGDYVSNQKSYSYDVWGRLTSFDDSLGGIADYTYYPDGLRRSKTTGGNTYQYYYNGDYVINETKNGSEFATNVFGVDGPISRKFNNYENYYYKNVHGDVIFAFTNGKWRSAEYSYGAYGNEGVSYDAFSDPNPIRYAGEYFDTESGMTYLRARYYDPIQRRFITEDPIKDGMNWYAYCNNNPVMFVDPSGCIIELSSNATDAQKQEYERTKSYLMQSEDGKALIEKLESAEEVFTIIFNIDAAYSSKYNPESRTIFWAYRGGMIMRDGTSVMSPAMSLAHEMGHGAQHIDGELDGKTRDEIESANLTKYEIPIANQLGEPTRPSYKSTTEKKKMNNSIHYITTHPGGTLGWLTPRIEHHNQWPIIETSISAAP